MGQAVSEQEYEAEMLRKSAELTRDHLVANRDYLSGALWSACWAVARSQDLLANALTLPPTKFRDPV